VETGNGLFWCPDLIECKFRAGRRLGIPLYVCVRGKARDLTRLAQREYRRAQAIEEMPPPVRDAEYADYISSAGWERFATEQKLLAGNRCEQPDCRICTWELEVHHLTYNNFKAERPEDVLVLCRNCHRDFDEQRRRKAQLPVEITVEGRHRVVKWPAEAA
jgi:hypothetical protein